MVNIVRKWIFNLVKPDYERDEKIASIKQYKSTLVSGDDSESLTRENSIRFVIHQATGGKIVETNRYSPSHDRSSRGLYIVESSENLGKKLEHIITMELLK